MATSTLNGNRGNIVTVDLTGESQPSLIDLTGNGQPKKLIDLPSQQVGGATCTFGLLSLINVSKGENTFTCEGSVASSMNKLFTEGSDGVQPFNHEPVYVRQSDDWDCGYRNLQMQISSTLPTLHNIFPHGIPTLLEIQSTLEEMWQEGFDPAGRSHFGGRLRGKEGEDAWLAATDVWSYLTYKRLDAVLVGFSGDQALAMFVLAYFSNRANCFTCGCSNGVCQEGRNSLATSNYSSYGVAERLIKDMNMPNSYPSTHSRCHCSIPPLYLQWGGHSVTIVGVEQKSKYDELLFIFCPKSIAASELKSALRDKVKHTNDGSNPPPTSFDQITESPFTLFFGQEQELQIILTTARVIDETEKNQRKRCKKGIGYIKAKLDA